MSDLALVVMTCAWILAAHRASQFVTSRIGLDTPRPLNLSIVRGVSAITIPVGCISVFLWSRIPGISPRDIVGSWASSNWIVIAQTWTGLGLLVLIYWYGFRPSLIVPLAAYLGLMVYQGNFRFRLLIPLILLVQIYLDRRGRSWPKLPGFAAILVCALLFFPLKNIGRQLQDGRELGDVWRGTSEEIGDVFRGNHPDEMILDEFASALTLADQHRRLYWGSTYAGLLTVAVPRQVWAAKPGLADFEQEISTKVRPLAANGMVVTMLGEFYLNFSYVGVVLLSFLVAYVTGAWFHRAYRWGYFSLMHFAYLLVACNLIQVFRDGLLSLFVFTVINMMPLTAIVVLHMFAADERDFVRESILKTPRVRRRADEQSIV